MYQSVIEQRGTVSFPQFAGERVYMLQIHDGKVPTQFNHWQRTVDEMLEGIPAPIAFLMIDQAVVQAGQPHRRPGLHVDGYWLAAGHGGGGHNSTSTPSVSGHGGGGRHTGVSAPSGHGGSKHGAAWGSCDFSIPEATILASSVSACRGFTGSYNLSPGNGGDCSHIDTGTLDEVEFGSGRVYAGNVGALHESLPLRATAARTLVRLTVPGWTPH